ncbi:hypothetical protein PLIIFM63780_005956 [Purpureocillium lilacinum]|uniref:Transmembrane protein n=1 Tax=Purpureocillium lilacinum TaxID=33203 RepID=A0ABR0C2P3_PURLI|nr:hypothetical protein Purlil1_4792 [Purpureocillium lilacinum]GJN71710.1 hypothetical protein PLICBS_005778 [Purpureocillium lilacinum]GJN82416.1 hypothetical protein PLIIFM63780_005956 [Purpureocillium lilacinum]
MATTTGPNEPPFAPASLTSSLAHAATPSSLDTLPGDIDIRERVLELIGGGSSGEKIIRGFLIGIALGLILGGVCCCWVPCFGRRQQEVRRRRRQERVRRGLPARRPLDDRIPWLRRRRRPGGGAGGGSSGDGGGHGAREEEEPPRPPPRDPT